MFGPMFNGYLMNTSDDVIENMLTHKVVKGRVPEADPTRAHLELVIPTEHEELYTDDEESEDIDMDLLCEYLIKEASKDET